MDIKEKINAVFNSDLTLDKISAFTNISIADLKKMKDQGDSFSLTISKAQKLERLYDLSVKNHLFSKNSSKEQRKFEHQLINSLQELYEKQVDREKRPEARDDESAITAAIEQLFDDILNDDVEVEKLFKVYKQKDKNDSSNFQVNN